MIARKYYERTSPTYWYGTKAIDLIRVKKYSITHFAFICATNGVVLLPKKMVLQEIENNNLSISTTKEGKLLHYHIHLFEKDGSIFWRLKNKHKKVDEFFFNAKNNMK